MRKYNKCLDFCANEVFIYIGSYNTYLNKFSECVRVANVRELRPEHFSDGNVAKYLYVLAVQMEWKPHAKKSGVAALNSKLALFGIRSVYDDITLWPLTQAMLSKWVTHLKKHPYV